ncbi:amino acid permease [Oerskovia sp. M15]
MILVMRMLAEMAAAVPSSGSFSVYAETALGRWAGFTLGWLYWFTLVMVLGAEITGASQIVAGWVPGVPQWVVALVFVGVFAVVNLWGSSTSASSSSGSRSSRSRRSSRSS